MAVTGATHTAGSGAHCPIYAGSGGQNMFFYTNSKCFRLIAALSCILIRPKFNCFVSLETMSILLCIYIFNCNRLGLPMCKNCFTSYIKKKKWFRIEIYLKGKSSYAGRESPFNLPPSLHDRKIGSLIV